MKKRRFSIMALTAVAALASAYATKPSCFQCEHTPQYHKVSGTYFPAGEFGLEFDCDEEISSTCTYYKPNPETQPNVYWPCRSGVFNDWSGRRAEK